MKRYLLPKSRFRSTPCFGFEPHPEAYQFVGCEDLFKRLEKQYEEAQKALPILLLLPASNVIPAVFRRQKRGKRRPSKMRAYGS